MDILSPQGRAALEAASAEPDPTSLGAAERMRRRFAPDLAAEALTQVSLRRRAQGKLPRAARMLLTSAGVEQATRGNVAAWRARIFADAGVREVWDLGCGLGADTMAFAEAGLEAHGVESDPLTASFATANLALVAGPPVIQGLAEDIDVPAGAGVFLDPARRTQRGRTWDVADFTPPWSVVTGYLAGPHFTCVKLGPGLPKELIPDGTAATWVSDGGSVVEVSLWNGRPEGRSAVVFPRSGGEPMELRAPEVLRELSVAEVGRYLIEPDNAIVRAGLVTEVAPDHDVWLLDPHIAYLSSDEALVGPLVHCFEVTAVLPHDLKAIRAHLRDNRIGILEIKLRGIDADPAELRRRLRPQGPASATLILSRTPGGAVALVTRRVT